MTVTLAKAIHCSGLQLPAPSQRPHSPKISFMSIIALREQRHPYTEPPWHRSTQPSSSSRRIDSVDGRDFRRLCRASISAQRVLYVLWLQITHFPVCFNGRISSPTSSHPLLPGWMLPFVITQILSAFPPPHHPSEAPARLITAKPRSPLSCFYPAFSNRSKGPRNF